VADEKFKLPGASYDELVKIIAAYASIDKDAAPGDVAQLAGKPPEEVSRNNGFLAAMGIVEGSARARRVTDEGRALARAIEHDQQEDVQRLWRTLCERSEFVQKVLSAVRVRRGMDRSTLVGHVVYTAGQRKTPQSTAGANCLVDILLMTSLVAEDNGKLVVTKPSPSVEAESDQDSQVASTGPFYDTAERELAISSYITPSQLSTWSSFSTSPRVPLEIHLSISVECTVDEIPSLAPRIRELIRELTATAQVADESDSMD
jgi:hypothetical protein